jgi:uncharacterized damage-inducible protein DinB
MSERELKQFLGAWEYEANNTKKLLRALPSDQYNFRPDPEGRSLGELAWHLAEIDAIFSNGVEQRSLAMDSKRPSGLERPRTTEEVARGYERIHEEAVARLKKLAPEDLDRKIPFVDGNEIAVRDVLWGVILHHTIHHRGQLQMMVRLARAVPPSMYGPSREDTLAMRARAQQKA